MLPSSYFLKIALLGDNRVGKTKIRNRFMGRGFRQEHLLTIGADFATKEQTLSNGIPATFQIWDLAGQDTFRSVRARFFRGVLGALITFDLSNIDTFMGLSKWIEELWRNNGRGIVPIILLGNKQDLEYHEIDTTENAEKYASLLTDKIVDKTGIVVKYFETSAITGHNIHEAFDYLGMTIADAIQRGVIKSKI